MTPVVMASHKILLLLFISCLFSPTIEVQVTYLYHNCSSNKTFAVNSAFQSDRTKLFSSLASANTDFSNATVVGGGDTVYGLFMCRGDVNLSMCHQCVVNATQRLSSECRVSKEAIIWYDECMVRYSNRSFFFTVETRPRLSLLNTGEVSQLSFLQILLSTLNVTADEAANGTKKYATREASISGFGTMYSLLQCTQDLSSQDCRTCLTAVIGDLSTWCCLGKQGGRVLYPSCNVRYELYPFYKSDDQPEATAPPPPALSPPTSSSDPQVKAKGQSTRTIVIVVVSSVGGLGIFLCVAYYLSKSLIKKRRTALLRQKYFGNESNNLEPLQFSLATIEAATNKFSHEKCLGQGGFGQVYKGVLSNGQEIAVKRLSKNSCQGGEEFKNEVVLIAKLQHRNLVALLGFCIEEQEKILVYEYVPNKSLDYFLFGSQKGKVLNWVERCKIIGGVARGILYLHEYSRLKIIHRDLKPSNILLDDELNPKISDFGLAKMVAINTNEGSTNRIVGTYGYMSPEYAMYGQYSKKSDTFSFGVIMLEIISGKKNASGLSQSQHADGLLSYAWKQWKEEKLLDILDSNIKEFGSYNEVIKCIQIGLLCVQEDPDARPTIAAVVSYLSNDSIQLPLPQEPAFFLHGGMGPRTSGSKESGSTIEAHKNKMPFTVFTDQDATMARLLEEEYDLRDATCIKEKKERKKNEEADAIVFDYVITRVDKNGEWRLTYEPSREDKEPNITCSCKKFEQWGILCCHALRILYDQDVKRLPQKYILKRWTREARCGVVYDSKGKEIEVDPKLECSNRYRQLCPMLIKLANDASECPEAFSMVHQMVLELSKKVSELLIKHSSDDVSSKCVVVDDDGKNEGEGIGFKKRERKKIDKSWVEKPNQKRRTSRTSKKPTNRPSQCSKETENTLGVVSLSTPVQHIPPMSNTLVPMQYGPTMSNALLPMQYGPSLLNATIPMQYGPPMSNTVAPTQYGLPMSNTLASMQHHPPISNTSMPMQHDSLVSKTHGLSQTTFTTLMMAQMDHDVKSLEALQFSQAFVKDEVTNLWLAFIDSTGKSPDSAAFRRGKAGSSESPKRRSASSRVIGRNSLHPQCSTHHNFTANSTFDFNLNTLFSSLTSNETAHLDFYNTTVDGGGETIYGLFMCRGDVNQDACHQCVVESTAELAYYCRFSKAAYEAAKPALMKKKSATKAVVVDIQTLYVMVQCTPDLSPGDCRTCLSGVIGNLPWCCEGKIGGRVAYPSCFARYELYMFFNSSTPLRPVRLPPPPPPPPPAPLTPPTPSDVRRKRRLRTIVIAVASPVGAVILLCFSFYLSKNQIKKIRMAFLMQKYFGSESNTLEPLQFSLATIEAATNKFSQENCLGQGGFGQVYKGILSNGQELAVKRLSKSSGQGVEEFKNEVLLIARLQHRNLVALLGFCIEGQEKILIYEYVPNKSLDYFLFGSQKIKVLNWEERCKIIGGVARGILYLHDYARVKIIHRDLKPSNILLDNEMNPKISDFGMARMVGIHEIEESTSNIVGTYGYMSPEYAMFGQYSEKSDVFSFGVIVLEMISGRKITSSQDQSHGLLNYAWNQWKEEKILDVLDSSLNEPESLNEVDKCIQIGLLCVQENPEARPSMATVVSYLSNDSIQLPFPQEPAFFLEGQMELNTDSKESINEMSISEFYPR
ncbi:uncharacterized protein LOC114733027 [Neltuma alba]|uniref:uncharacterized protein LOC114733027 n=1 Tax=Neltuma alba TaxID=207710 RepID=UPI0010A31A05|nr:uncharacterized protein LOC114733027 [Prosopis alba]